MGAKSLLELLQEEYRLCGEVQNRVNVLSGLRAAVADGAVDGEAHRDLEERLVKEIGAMHQALYPLRLAIGAKLMDLQAMAERAISAKLESVERGGADGGVPS